MQRENFEPIHINCEDVGNIILQKVFICLQDYAMSQSKISQLKWHSDLPLMDTYVHT
jgi:hypothetical protein